MPNLNEFIKPEVPKDPQLEKIDEPRPCSHCEKDSEFYYWNSSKMEMSWSCPDGHKNSYRIN
jgi:hypothetical protein